MAEKKGRKGRCVEEIEVVHVFNDNPTREDIERAADGLTYVYERLARHDREREEPLKEAE